MTRLATPPRSAILCIICLMCAAMTSVCLVCSLKGGVGETIGRLESVCGADIVLDREAIPVTPDVAAVCSRFYTDLLHCSSEGVIIAVIPESLADAALAAMRRSAHGQNAAIIGYVAGSQT